MIDPILPFDAPLSAYRERAQELHRAALRGDAAARRLLDVHFLSYRSLSHVLRPEVALHAVARANGFFDVPALEAHVRELRDPRSAVRALESAIDAVQRGDLARLDALLRSDPDLVHRRSLRRRCCEGEPHHATLLHHLCTDELEPARLCHLENAVELLQRLLAAGAEVDARAAADVGSRTPIELLVRSGSRAAAGVQVPLLHALIDAGACFDGAESPPRLGPLRRALAFSFLPAARALAERGARIDSLALAAGLGDLEFARTLLGSADLAERRAAMIFAAMHGHVPLVTLLLDAGGEIDRREPDDFGNAAAPLHHAAIHGQLEVVRVLVARGADLDRRDRTSQRTAFEWAVQNEHYEVAAFLRSARGLTPS